MFFCLKKIRTVCFVNYNLFLKGSYYVYFYVSFYHSSGACLQNGSLPREGLPAGVPCGNGSRHRDYPVASKEKGTSNTLLYMLTRIYTACPKAPHRGLLRRFQVFSLHKTLLCNRPQTVFLVYKVTDSFQNNNTFFCFLTLYLNYFLHYFLHRFHCTSNALVTTYNT